MGGSIADLLTRSSNVYRPEAGHGLRRTRHTGAKGVVLFTMDPSPLPTTQSWCKR